MKKQQKKLALVGLDHIAIAPKDPEKAKIFFNEILGLKTKGEIEKIDEQKVEVSTLELDIRNQTEIEILDSSKFVAGPIKKFIENRGGGIHHLALQVENIQLAIEHLLAHEVELITEDPQQGKDQSKIIFIHPRSTGGILIELVQKSS